MDNNSFHIRASRSQFRILLIVSGVLVLGCLKIAYDLATGKAFSATDLGLVIFTIIVLVLMIEQRTEWLFFQEGRLMRKSFFGRQGVYLASLIRAERYARGKYPIPYLKLEDAAGSVLVLKPGDFSKEDLNALVALISPYVLSLR